MTSILRKAIDLKIGDIIRFSNAYFEILSVVNTESETSISIYQYNNVRDTSKEIFNVVFCKDDLIPISWKPVAQF